MLKSLLLLTLLTITVAAPALAQIAPERYPIRLFAVESQQCKETTYVVPTSDHKGYSLYASIEGEGVRGIFSFYVQRGSVKVTHCNNTESDFPAMNAFLVLKYIKNTSGSDVIIPDGCDNWPFCEFDPDLPPPPPVVIGEGPQRSASSVRVVETAKGQTIIITYDNGEVTIIFIPTTKTLREQRRKRG